MMWKFLILNTFILFSFVLGLSSAKAKPDLDNLIDNTDSHPQSPLIIQSFEDGLLGKYHWEVEGAQFQSFMRIIANIRREIGKIPKLKGELILGEEIQSSGLGNLRIRRAVLVQNGIRKNVFVKYINFQKRTPEVVANEALMIMLLNKVGLCPEFFGLAQFPGDELALVSEYVEGVKISEARLEQITAQSFEEIKHIGRILLKMRIPYAQDLQLILGPKGEVHLIDVEYFSFDRPLHHSLPIDIRFQIRSELEALSKQKFMEELKNARDLRRP